jgi:hypothetical protein
VGRIRRLLERVVLGTFFGIAVFLLERRLRRAIGKSAGRRSRSRTADVRQL